MELDLLTVRSKQTAARHLQTTEKKTRAKQGRARGERLSQHNNWKASHAVGGPCTTLHIPLGRGFTGKHMTRAQFEGTAIGRSGTEAERRTKGASAED